MALALTRNPITRDAKVSVIPRFHLPAQPDQSLEDAASRWCWPVPVGWPGWREVEVTHFGLAWAPYWRVPNPAGWTDELPAYR
jgi:hypothetical protein